MNRQTAGFTLVELAFVSTILTIAVGMVVTCFEATSRSLHADDLVARSMEKLQRSAVRIAHLMRPGLVTTYRVLSTAADVPLAASAPGEWIEAVDGEPRPVIQFRSSAGTASLNATALTSERTLRRLLEPGESDNGLDDDGDGLVDEGTLMLDYDGLAVALARDVENATFTLTGRLLVIRLQTAARRRDGSVQRFSVQETLCLRNN